MRNKQELRARLKEKRAALTPEERKRADALIVRRIAESEPFKRASMLLLYAPTQNETDVLPLVRLAREKNIPVAFPRCDVESETMRFYLLEPTARLTLGAYRIPEPPADAPLCVPDERALCILPALAFDRSGARLGYGKGYYDKFLADFKGIAAGVAREGFLFETLPTEAHDKRVSLVFTDRGVCHCGEVKKKAAHTADLSARVGAFFSDLPKNMRAWWKNLLRDATEGELKAPLAPPILVASTFVLLLLSRLIDTALSNRDNEFAVVILLQILIFLIPAVIYVKLRGDAFPQRIRMRLPRPEHLWFTVCILVVMITGGMLCGILTGGIASLRGNFTLYDTFIARGDGSFWDVFYLILAYGLLPAFCEELVYRAILCAEYEKFSAPVAIAVSALFFSMLHASLPLFLTYLFLGLLLSGAMYTTRSFAVAFLLHLGYNLFCLFGQPYLSAFYVNAGSNEIFVFCLVVLALLFAAFAAGEARKIYHRYAKQNLDSSHTPRVPWRELPHRFLSALLTIPTAVCLLIFLIVSIAKAV